MAIEHVGWSGNALRDGKLQPRGLGAARPLSQSVGGGSLTARPNVARDHWLTLTPPPPREKPCQWLLRRLGCVSVRCGLSKEKPSKKVSSPEGVTSFEFSIHLATNGCPDSCAVHPEPPVTAWD